MYTYMIQQTYVLIHSDMSDSLQPLWTVAHQAPLSMGILQARILEWAAISSSRRFSGSNLGLLCCGQILYHLNYQGFNKYIYIYIHIQQIPI